MKAYVTSIGEKTTDICVRQLKRYGFDVVLLDKKEPWIEKYKNFIDKTPREDCLRVDADVVVNKHIKEVFNVANLEDILMAQFSLYDLYQNDIFVGQPVLYKKASFKIIQDNFWKLQQNRPEATAWRLEDINHSTFSSPQIVGMHGFFQDEQTVTRAIKNKEDRHQMGRYDFQLVKELMIL